MRILYMSGVWSYIVGFTSTPMFVIIPVVSHTARTLLLLVNLAVTASSGCHCLIWLLLMHACLKLLPSLHVCDMLPSNAFIHCFLVDMQLHCYYGTVNFSYLHSLAIHIAMP